MRPTARGCAGSSIRSLASCKVGTRAAAHGSRHHPGVTCATCMGGNVSHVFGSETAGTMLASGFLLLYSAMVVPVQLCMWDYDDPCNKFPTLYFDVFVDIFFMVWPFLQSIMEWRRLANAVPCLSGATLGLRLFHV